MATGTVKQVTNNSGSGYCKMPDGTLMQWGMFQCNDDKTSEYYSLELPIAFISNDVSKLAIAFSNYGADTGQEHISLYNIENNCKTCTVRVVKPTGWAAFMWIVIGRWK